MGVAKILLKISPVVGLLCALLLAGNGAAAATRDAGSWFKRTDYGLPGAQGLVSLDYFVFDAANHRLWVPAANMDAVVIIDDDTQQVTALSGFPTAQVDFRGKRPVMGPTSITLGDGVAYAGNRGNSTLWVIDVRTLRRGNCLALGSTSKGLAAAPDALTYVAATRELWVTRGVPPMGVSSIDRAITVFDASTPRV